MKSEVIRIENKGGDYQAAIEEANKIAAYERIDARKTRHLQLATEEMINLICSVTGNVYADFWIEYSDEQIDLHLSTSTLLDKEMRRQLIEASSARKNEAAKSFLGRLRDAFETALLAQGDRDYETPEDIVEYLSQEAQGKSGWDGLEKSILQRMTDRVKIGIVNGVVDMTVSILLTHPIF